MVLESFWLGAAAVSLLFVFIGWRAETSLGRSFLMWGGLVFILLGLILFTDGIEREVNYTFDRDPFDNNRVTDVNVSTTTYLASPLTTPPPSGVKFDFGLWIISQIVYYIFGWVVFLYGFYLTFSLAWKERFGKQEPV